MRNIKQEKGITIIALILMIILMLILVRASVTILAGNDGVIKETENVVNTAELNSLKEAIREELKNEEMRAKLEGKNIDSNVIQAIADKYNVNYDYAGKEIILSNGDTIDLTDFNL